MILEQKSLQKNLLDVPKGQITTYGDLAKILLELKNGQRIIGKIMNQKPLPCF